MHRLMVRLVAVLGVMTAGSLSFQGSAYAQSAQPSKAAAPKQDAGKETTLTGRIVDLHCYMSGKYDSADHAKCTQSCIRGGVPALLETKDGIVFLSQGNKSGAELFAPLAMQETDLHGTLYEKNGVKYLDVSDAKQHAAAPANEPVVAHAKAKNKDAKAAKQGSKDAKKP